jgi:hypothetical protein
LSPSLATASNALAQIATRLGFVEVEVFVLPDDELQCADDLVGRGISHGCAQILLASNLEPLIGPGEVCHTALNQLEQSLEDFEGVPLVSRLETVEWFERIGRDDTGQLEI